MDSHCAADPSDARSTLLRATLLRAGLSRSGMRTDELQVACTGLADTLSLDELFVALAGDRVLTDHQYDVVAQALNDRFIDLSLQPLVPSAAATHVRHRRG